MHVINEGGSPRKDGHGAAIAAIVIVALGLVFLGRNLGLINHGILRIIISWQMLLIVLGAVLLSKRNNTGGAILIGVGLFFIVPRLTGAGMFWASTWWPLLLVALGIILLIRYLRPESQVSKSFRGNNFASEVSYKTDKGFVDSEVAFGSVNHIVVDPIFKGARIRNSFGATVLDLRRTTLEDADTFIDLDCNFGGIEIYVPSNWTVHTQVKNFLGGTEDKRFRPGEINNDGKRVIIRGNVSFGGVEIKG
ncbi:MAG: LiaF-related protein [Bacteroidales bacterium]|jgi:predicted membrane protein|nr:LiaF-related protein [Bacteroidales bacterium]MDD3273884.1 LiaF-related protein [Bacteroidales bacterium]